ncbi:SirB2 family protein [Marinimicrobium sp. ARAG 43.8]|uniref:SirB2 family protein n=1 Tax=Marinimicrobium sp. ARAG 43.8 TaxID=3418719 RepID=UPI003CE80651
MIDVVLLKHLHVSLVFISISFFLVRFLGRQLGAGFMQARAVKIAPHIIDTLLLASGITLASIYRLSPLDAHWLLVKLILIGGYIGSGFGAMKAPAELHRNLFALLALSLITGAIVLAVIKPF